MSSEFDSADLPDYMALRSQVAWDFTLRNYVETHGTVELAVAFAAVFWPDFIEHRGCVIRADGFDEANFEQWWERTGGDCQAIERAVNLLHVADLIPNDPQPPTARVRAFLVRRIAAMWAARVRSLFPARRFVVQYDLEGELGPGYTISLCQDYSQNANSTPP